MRKRKQILKTNILAQMLYERYEEKVKRLYAFTYTNAYAYTYAAHASASYTSAAHVSAYASAASAYTSTYTSASAEWKQISRSGPDQIMLIVEGIKLL